MQGHAEAKGGLWEGKYRYLQKQEGNGGQVTSGAWRGGRLHIGYLSSGTCPGQWGSRHVTADARGAVGM